MNTNRPLRVMWLLNHTTLRRFEIPQLMRLGVEEIYTPKRFPYDEGNLSASVTHEFDATLGLSSSEIDLLNSRDWYDESDPAIWSLVNKHFDIVFIGFFQKQILSVCRHFKGAIVIRAFGLGEQQTYSNLIRTLGGPSLQSAIARSGKRFWFGMGYDHLSACEDSFISGRAIFLPVGLPSVDTMDQWTGEERLIYIVCPRINSSPYYERVYREFRQVFKGLPYRVGGAQPIEVNDSNVLGFVDNERHSEIMRTSRVMFYHSREPNHVHYHPFEAVRAGMPLVFMAGGMLDHMGGGGLPGRCKSIAEAKRKLERILADDRELIDRIRHSQTILLEPMRPESCEVAWHKGMARVASVLKAWRSEQTIRPSSKGRKRVAVVLPAEYRGGSLRGALLLAKALSLGSRQWKEDSDVVFLHLDDPKIYSKSMFDDLPDTVVRRPFSWKVISAAEARRAMHYAGFQGWEPAAENYMVADDGIRQLQDCDLWVIVSDRLKHPLLPLKPVVLMVYDYIQRYENLLPETADMPFLAAARAADRVFVTTEFTRRDALQYAGVDSRKVIKVPMLVPEFPIRRSRECGTGCHQRYFIWTTNDALHKNHVHAAEALRIYYEELDGRWECWVTGSGTKEMVLSEVPHLRRMADVFGRSESLRERVRWMGELPDARYRSLLARAEFLWHPARIDNGTFSVIEAACFGVPSLSSDYPAMREIDERFSLHLAWMDPDCPRDMAERLKRMEIEVEALRDALPNEDQLGASRVECHAAVYWAEVRACL